MTQDTNLKRITVANDDGDVYVESAGEYSEIVMKTQKVRVDGDVYCHGEDVGLKSRIDGLNATDAELKGVDAGLASRIDALNSTDDGLKTRLDALNATDDGLKSRIDGLDTKTTTLTPPKCMPPGGDKLRFDGTNWLCVCTENWSGPTCETPPSPPPSPSPPPPYVTPPPAPPNPPPSPPPNPLSPNERLRLAVKTCVTKSPVGDCVCDYDSPCGYVTDGRSIGAFDTSNVTDMRELFKDASLFNQDISGWDTSQVTSMDFMFQSSEEFNKPLDSWNVASVTSARYMFQEAGSFNQPINSWNVSAVNDFRGMFQSAGAFNGDVTNWNVSGAGSRTTCAQDEWGNENCQVGSLVYMFYYASNFNQDVRTWDVGGDVEVGNMFRETRFAQSFKCPNDGDGPPSACYVSSFTSDYALVQAVDACFEESFDGDCRCMNKCGEAGLPISKWNTTGIIYMQNLFYDRAFFNQDLNEWNTKSVIRMDDMFRNAVAFNGNLSSWTVSLVQDASNMFNGASTFSGDVSTWDVPSGMNVTDMFKDADAFNARFACSDVDDGPPNTCAERTYPSSLVHRLDFSEDRFVETTGSGVVASFTDVAGRATNLQVFGSPTYERRVHAGLNGIKFSSDGSYLSMTAVGGQEPEVFIVYRVFEYKDKGLILSHGGSTVASYGFGTYSQGGVGKVGVVRSSGASLASVDAATEKWHVANVYYGKNDGFVDVNDGSSTDTLNTQSKFNANALTKIQIGGSKFAGHDVSNVVGEVLVFDSKLSDADRASVRKRLMTKWDVPTPDRRWRWVSDGNVTAGSDAAANDQFGRSVSVSGDTMVVGAPYDDHSSTDSGSAYVFTRSSSGVWTQQQKLTASDAAVSDYFGTSVSVSGDTLVVGAPYDDNTGGNNGGSAYVFTRSSSGVWTQQENLKASDASSYDYFGTSVSISGDTVIVGAPYDDDNGKSSSGSAYVFIRSSSGVWSQQAKLTAEAESGEDDQFGRSVSVSGDTVVVGAPNDDNDGKIYSGSAYIFTRSSSNVWSLMKQLTPGLQDAGDNNKFGSSVSIDADVVVIGVPNHEEVRDQYNNVLYDHGSVFVYVRGSNGEWSREAKLFAKDASYYSNFGSSVSAAGDSIIVGSPQFDLAESRNDAGKAYLFRRSGTKWVPVSEHTLSSAKVSDNFGYAVAITKNYAVVAAPYVDKTNSSDVFVNTGAAYAFALA